MPVYEIEDSKTGMVIEVEGDSPPTEQEMQQIFSEYQPEGGMIDAVIEPAQAVGGNMLNTAISGIAGLGDLAINQDSQSAAQTIENVQNAMPDFSPETKAGKKGLERLGDLVELGIDVVNFPISGLAGLAALVGSGGDIDKSAGVVGDIQDKGLSETLGDNAYESTGSPLAATAAFMAPDVVATVTGTKAAKSIAKTANAKLGAIANARKQKALVSPSGEVTPAFEKALKRQGMVIDDVIDDLESLPEIADPNKAVSRLIKQKLQRGDTDGVLATRKIDDFGNVVVDKTGKEAIRQGLAEGDVQAIKAAKSGSKKAMQEMLRIRRSIHNNTRKAVDVQPTDVVGRSAMKRFNHIRQTAQGARKELDNIARNKLKGLKIDSDSIGSKFLSELEKLDVKINRETLPPTIDFKGSQIVKDRSAQKVIKDTLDLLSENEAVDALRAHKLKRQLDTMIDYKKRTPGALTPKGEDIAVSVRRSLNDAIRNVDDGYARVNDTLSESLDAINEFSDVLGPSINPFKEGAEKAVGQDLRGLLSNRKTKTNLENAVKKLDSTAKDLGGKFDDDIGDLVNFNGILQSRFGSTKRHSFSGEIGAETARGAKRLLRGKDGLMEAGVDVAAEGIEKLRNIDDVHAFKSISELLKNKP